MALQFDARVDHIRRAHHDLRGAIEHAIHDALERLGVHVTFSYSGTEQVPVAIVTVVDEFVREALDNVARHAGTSTASVEVSVGDELWLRVRDHGHGSDADLLAGLDRGDTHFQRAARAARTIGARISARTSPGQGTSLRLRMPVPAPY